MMLYKEWIQGELLAEVKVSISVSLKYLCWVLGSTLKTPKMVQPQRLSFGEGSTSIWGTNHVK